MNKIDTMDEDAKQVKSKKRVADHGEVFTNPITKQPIVFSEWSAVNGSMLKRRDYTFKFLMEMPH